MPELSIIKIIIIGLQYLNLYYVADAFLIISIVLFSIAIYKRIRIIPTLLTSFGIFATILLISISLSHFDSNSIENSIPNLLNNLIITLIFGFINLLLVLTLRFIKNRKTPENSEITPTDIYLTLREITTYNDITQKPLLNNIFEQLRLSQENTQRIPELHRVGVSQELDLLKNIKNALVDKDSLIKQIKIEITNGFNRLFIGLDNKVDSNNIAKIHAELQNITSQINSIPATKLATSLQTIQPYLESLQQLHIQANDTFPKIEQNLTELTQGMQQVLQNNLDMLNTSVETQLDMAEVLIENNLQESSENSQQITTDKSALEEFNAVYNQAFSCMDSGDYENAIIYFSQAIEINPQEFSLFYNQACCYAMLDKTESALDALQNAILLDGQCIEMANTDLDFDKIRYDSKFQALLN